MKDIFDLTGKTAVITGGGRGIGKGIARGLASKGADIIIAARDEERMRRTAKELEDEFHVRTACIRTDVQREDQVKEMIEEVIRLFGSVQILVNNAGIAIPKLPQQTSTEEWDSIIDINLKSAFLCSKGFYPFMKKGGGGKIICLGSMYSIFGGALSAAYAASKGGVVQLVRSLAVAWASANIQVNAILPGWIETDMVMGGEAMFPGMVQWIVGRTPSGRLGQIDDLAGTAIFLASSASNFVTGVSIPVDGGWSVLA